MPVAMQIRYAGCKGMLVLDPNLKDKKIVFRKSMKKFSSNDDALDVIKVNEPSKCNIKELIIIVIKHAIKHKTENIGIINFHLYCIFYILSLSFACNLLRSVCAFQLLSLLLLF